MLGMKAAWVLWDTICDLLSTEGEYQLWVKTAPDSSPANGGKVSIAVYGSKGHRKDVELFGPKKQDHLFEPGNIDEFEVSEFWWSWEKTEGMIDILHNMLGKCFVALKVTFLDSVE